jgi:thiamine-phosphate pyrophosphorylase
MALANGKPLVYLISDNSITDDNFQETSDAFLELLSAAVAAGVSMVQIREKHLSARLLFDLAKRASSISKGTGTMLLINDRLDIALAADADGVHLTTMSITPDLVRRYVADGFLVGVSTHSSNEIQPVAQAGADFAVFGPVFRSPGKPAPTGIDGLTDAVKAVDGFPVLALGGIDASNYRQVMEAGAAGFAAIRFLNDVRNFELLTAANVL